MRLVPAEAEALWPRVALALIEQRRQERRWWSYRFALVVCSQATGKDGKPLEPWQVFPELAD